MLRLADQGPEHRTGVVGGEKLCGGGQVVPQVGFEAAEVWWIELESGIFQKDVHQHVRLRVPPSIDGLLSHSGSLGDALHGDSRIALGDQQIIGSVDDGFACGLAAAMPVSVMTARLVGLAGLRRLIHSIHRIITLD
ncbi:Uncharacterised protein [Mycobacteroides abscessus subsp. massiliense]|nr:Uncharacterised protein [Mycobacteroides abscessus subsp. massiliense]